MHLAWRNGEREYDLSESLFISFSFACAVQVNVYVYVYVDDDAMHSQTPLFVTRFSLLFLNTIFVGTTLVSCSQDSRCIFHSLFLRPF